jgi:hypothetical protein
MTSEPQNDKPQPAIAPVAAAPAPVLSQQEQAEMMSAEIKKTWNKLSDEDVQHQKTQPDQFFAALREKHNVTRDDAQKRLKEIKASCGACTSEKAA